MSEALQFNRLLVRSLTVAVGLISLLPTVAGAVVLGPKQHGPLAPALQKLSKQAIAASPPAQQADALGLPAEGPGSLIREGRRVLVDVRFDGAAASPLDALREAAAKVIAVSRRYKTVTAATVPTALPKVAAAPGVGAITPVPTPLVYAGECEGGSVVSEGVAQINAKAAREAFGVDGEGVTVGVISDSFDRDDGAATDAKGDVETADLPGPANPCLEQKTPVDVRQDLAPTEEGTDEGRAMLQIVHDVAPAADLAFATGYFGESAFAQRIEELAAPFPAGAGAKVIVDDLAYPEEPFFQDGPIAAAVNKVMAEGVTYLSAAGNDNLLEEPEPGVQHDIASWEAPSFRDANSCPAVVQGLSGFNGTHCMDFAPASPVDTTFGITVEPEDTLTVGLQWAEPWFGVGTDMDAFLLDDSGASVLEAAYFNNTTGTERPAELLSWENPSSSPRTVQFVVNRYTGGNPRLKFILMQNGGGVSAVEYPTSTGGDEVGPAVFGHAGAAGAVAVGAVPFNNSAKPERYSSRGPVLHLFDEVNGPSPAAPFPSPQLIPKPDVAATDCGATTFFAFFAAGAWRFCGTSAAAPHAAGAAALMVQAGEAAGGGLDEPEPIRAALQQSASPVGAFGPCAVGAGLVETRGAVEALLANPGPPAPLACVAPLSPPAEGPAQSAPAVPPAIPPPPKAVRPNTKILKHPAKVVPIRGTRARVVFRFGSNQRQVTFLCKLDRERFKACGARLVRRLPAGRHVLRVKARGAGGLLDPTPAIFRFRIERL